MSLVEAERNAAEMVLTAKNYDEFDHYVDLKRSLEADDFEKLGEILDENNKR